MQEKNNIPPWEKVLLTREEAMEYSNIGANTLGYLLSKPKCPFVLKVVRKKIIKRKEFEQFLEDSIEI